MGDASNLGITEEEHVQYVIDHIGEGAEGMHILRRWQSIVPRVLHGRACEARL